MSDLKSPTPVYVDVHAHYYAAFGVAHFLDAAWRNLGAAGAAADCAGRAVVLLDIRSSNWLADWRQRGLGDSSGGWVAEATGELISLRASHPDGRRLLLVAGRQFNSAEGVEVVLIGHDKNAFADGLPLRRYLDSAAADCVVLLPWGAGKWFGSRGELIKQLLRENPGSFFLGDNVGRPAALAPGAQFDLACAQGVPVLPGSDPLPIASHATRVGMAGCKVAADIEGIAPGAALVSALGSLRTSNVCFGSFSALLPFIRDQLMLRLRRIG